jgi:hypothetical protein
MTSHCTDHTILHDFTDRLLPPEQQQEVAAHLTECSACAAVVEDIRHIQSSAADLPSGIEAPADIWAGIAERLDEPASTSRQNDRSSSGLIRSAWAAAALIAFAFLWSGLRSDPPVDNPSLALLDMTYEDVRHDGQVLLETDAVGLSATSATALRDGMAAIDDAVKETRLAFSRAADAPGQLRHLTEGYQKKIDLLQQLISYAAQH